MKYITNLVFLSIIVAITSCSTPTVKNERINFNKGWKFLLLDMNSRPEIGFEDSDFEDDKWESVSLPHTAHLEEYVCNNMWQGLCYYRKSFDIPLSYKKKKLILEFEGAMGVSKFWVNGKEVVEHQGGYLPVVLDISDFIIPGGENVIAVKLNNNDNSLTGPKPLKKLDFCFYGGLYRNAHLIVKDKVHISHPALANKVAGGGVFVHTPIVAEKESVVAVTTNVKNEGESNVKVKLIHSLAFDGNVICKQESNFFELPKNMDIDFIDEILVKDAQLWSPKHPNLYTLETRLFINEKEVEVETTRIGIREFKFTDNQLYINSEKEYLRGTNRHQEYPYVGYALSDNAQYRDAKRIKESGFDFVRLSHYPHSPAFMDACDELGLVVLDAILGWQYYLNDDRFREYCYNSARQLVRRDRNHPCVLAWEVSLNETHMPTFFMQELHEIVHKEYPHKQAYSAGWKPEVYDIYIEARQHRILHPFDVPDKPHLVSEYGDWEYYSRNAGLNQHNLDKQLRIEKSSRQLRKYGETRLLQQCQNIQEALNDNMANTSAFGDGFWVMYDYNSGVHAEHCCSGVMDMNRIRKFSSWFYQSQRDLDEDTVLQIASYWNEDSPLDLKVYSNCDEVELFLNGSTMGRQKPDSNKNSSHLNHPPFTFHINQFEKGEIVAFGYDKGENIVEHKVLTPGKPVALKIWLDDNGIKPQFDCNDVLFAYVAAVDENGTIVPSCSEDIKANASDNIKILNVDNFLMEAGIATLLIRIGENTNTCFVEANTNSLNGKLSFTPSSGVQN